MAQNEEKDKDQRTNIEDISPAGEELSGDQMRLVSGGLRSSGLMTDKKTHSPGTDWDADSDATDHVNDSLPVASPILK